MKGKQGGITAQDGLTAQASEDLRPPFGQVDDPRRDALRVQSEPENVERRLEQVRRGSGDQSSVASTMAQWRSMTTAG